VMEFEGFVSMGSPRLYKHIPFYTTYRKIDTAKDSFYAQFSENAFEFGPEKGRQDLYDTQFNQLASRNASSYEDQFNGEELTRIDVYLGDHSAADIDEKREAIRQLLDSPETDGAELTPAGSAPGGMPLSETELNAYMTQMGYEKFSGSDGKTGVKKDGKILLPARFELVRWGVTALFSPPKMELAYLKRHFAGRYKENEEELFMVFGIAAGGKEKGILYTMNGEEAIDITERIPEKATTAGLIYRTIERDTAEDRTVYRFGCVNWKGQDVLPPNYTRIQLLDGNRMLTKREKETARGMEEHVGLYNASGETIIPEGVFSAIEPISNTPNLLLAEWADPYPTKAEQQERELENKDFVLLNIEGNAYTVVQRFTASQVYTRRLDLETGLLKYRKKPLKNSETNWLN
ncbi:MAG TPA: hypothetical protein VNQ55_09960, partial [Parapedobacter sp.]|nr:hypothetical protein [Parapedobacter sp.]